MIDREKVIKGLEHCTNGRNGCFECPYSEDGFSATIYCKLQVDRDALKLLKEQQEQIKNRDESLEKAQEEIKWLRGMLKEQERIIKLYEKAEPFLHSHGWDWTQVEGWVKQE